MAIKFHADAVSIRKPDWGRTVHWGSEEQVIAEKYLAVQRKKAFSAQDICFGFNDVYIECCGQGWSWYGHILLFELFRDRVRAELDQEAAERMRNDGTIEVPFTVSDGEFADLAGALDEVFDGFDYYKDLTRTPPAGNS